MISLELKNQIFFKYVVSFFIIVLCLTLLSISYYIFNLKSYSLKINSAFSFDIYSITCTNLLYPTFPSIK